MNAVQHIGKLQSDQHKHKPVQQELHVVEMFLLSLAKRGSVSSVHPSEVSSIAVSR
jgi:hypothetical protein